MRNWFVRKCPNPLMDKRAGGPFIRYRVLLLSVTIHVSNENIIHMSNEQRVGNVHVCKE